MVMRIFPKMEGMCWVVYSLQYHLFNCSGEAGKLVDSYISDKILQLKEQIATLEKREERWVYNLLPCRLYDGCHEDDSRIIETLKYQQIQDSVCRQNFSLPEGML